MDLLELQGVWLGGKIPVITGTVDLFRSQIANATEKQFLKDARSKQFLNDVSEKRFIKWVQ